MQDHQEQLLESESEAGHPRVHKSWWEKTCTCLGLGCCIDSDKWKQRPLAELTQDEDRQCTDVPCLLFLVAVLISHLVLISVASSKGANTKYLLNGYDYNGSICNSHHSEGKYTAWPALDVSYDVRVCVHSCEQTKSGDDSRFKTTYRSRSFMNSWCLPKSDALKNATNWAFNKNNQAFSRAIGDLDTAKYVILIAAFVAIAVGFLYIKMVSFLARVLVFLSIVATFVGGALLGGYLIKHGAVDIKDDETKKMGQTELAFGIAIIACLFMLFFALIWLRKRIELAFAMLEEASRAVRDMSTVLFFPIFYSLIVIGYGAFWVAIAIYLFSAKEKHWKEMPEELVDDFGEEYAKVNFDSSLKRAVTWHFVCLVYVMQVLMYFGFMVLAGTFADWYFSEWSETDEDKKKRGEGVAELSKAPLTESLLRVLKFHIGSLSFGAMLITPIRILRAWLTYTQKKTEASQNAVAKCMFGMVECCLKCCECLIDKANREGFIFTAITGSNFCYSSLTAVELIMKNVARAAMVESISSFLELFGRICIMACTTGICVLIMTSNQYLKDNLSSVFLPAVMIAVISYLIASLFMDIYDCAVDTIFLAYLVDEVVHKTPRFAHRDMIRKGTEIRKSVAADGGVAV